MLLLLLIVSGKLIALFSGLFFFKSLTLPYKLILAQTAIALICEITGYYASFGTQNAWIFNLFYLLPELWLTGLAGILLLRHYTDDKISPILIIAGTLVWLISVILFGLNTFSHWGIIAIGIVLIGIFLRLLINNGLFNKNLFKNSVFWLSISVILYFSCTIPYFGLYKYLLNNFPLLLKKLFSINLIFNIARYPLVAIAFYWLTKNKIDRVAQIKNNDN